jgi:P-type Cu+ transporter
MFTHLLAFSFISSYQTTGVPVVSDLVHLTKSNESNQASEDYLLWLLGSLERTSEHPLAKAIVKFAEERLGTALELNPFSHPTEFRAITGRGASGKVMGKVCVSVGNRSFAATMGLVVTPHADLTMQRLEEAGKTAILAAVDGQVCLVLGIIDEVKPDAAASISYLRDRLGMDVWMVTGDNSRTAAAIGQQVGLPMNRVVAESLPADKLENVRKLQLEGRNIVCMVGDGINDSAALAQADVGISMGTGADIAMEASDMILVKGHVADVCTALHLSRAIFRRIQWNLALSLVYNCLGIPIAAGIFYPFAHIRLPPTLAAVAMALSSVSVVLSSLTLRFYHPPNIFARRGIISTTVWDRTMPRSNSRSDDDSSDMRQHLLSNDQLASASELTQPIDNRSSTRTATVV